MYKQAISLTLSRQSLMWLRAKSRLEGARSISETVDRILLAVRAQDAEVRSVVGSVTIAEDDPELLFADEAVRSLFPSARAIASTESRAAKPKKKRRAPAKRVRR